MIHRADSKLLGNKYSEIESPRANLADDPSPIEKPGKTAPDRVWNHLVDPAGAVKEACELLFDKHGQMRARVGAPNRKQRGQAHHDVAEPVNFLDEDARGRRLEHNGGRRRRRCARIELGFMSDIFGFHDQDSRRYLRCRRTKISSRERVPNKPADSGGFAPDGADNLTPTPSRAGRGTGRGEKRLARPESEAAREICFRVARDRTSIRIAREGIAAMAGLRDRPLMRDALLAGGVIAAGAIAALIALDHGAPLSSHFSSVVSAPDRPDAPAAGLKTSRAAIDARGDALAVAKPQQIGLAPSSVEKEI